MFVNYMHRKEIKGGLAKTAKSGCKNGKILFFCSGVLDLKGTYSEQFYTIKKRYKYSVSFNKTDSYKCS